MEWLKAVCHNLFVSTPWPRRPLIILTALSCWPVGALAQASSPIGLWQTVDDHTGRERSVVRIFEHDGRLYGNVERVLNIEDVNRTCDHCTDDRKDKPVVGLQIMRGLAQSGDGWDGGTILDPESGEVYRCLLRLKDNGRKLVVRGYIGISLLGRSQTWLRVGSGSPQ